MSQTPACPDVPDDERADRYRSWSDKDMAAQCRMQARENLDPDYSRFMYALAERLADRATRALPSTALAARPEEGWEIKPLEWGEPYNTEGDQPDTACTAESSLGRYIATGSGWFIQGVTRWNSVVGLLASQAAAQADYETRIRSAFVAPSTPPTAGDGHD